MTLDTLNDLLKQATEQNNIGNYDEAEKIATTVLTELKRATDSGEDQAASERRTLYCSTLNSLAFTNYLRGDFQEALTFARASLDHVETHTLTENKAKALNITGVVYHSLGSYDKAFEFSGQALAAYKVLADKSGVAKVTANTGALYINLGSYNKALECYQQALAAQKELGDTSAVARVTGNIGIIYYYLGSYDKALECMEQALAAHKELGEKSGAAGITGNIGNVYFSLGSFDNALEYYEQSLAAHKLLGDKSAMANVTEHIGALFANKNYHRFDAAIAEEFLNNAIALANEIGAKALLVGFHQTLANFYENEGRWQDAFAHLKKYIEIVDDLNIEEAKKQDSIREQRKAIELENAKADAKHQATEELLHNVLPPSIANKMLDGTKLIAEKLPSVSVMFADIVNFTKLSQRITPEELVEGLDGIFSIFDALAEKHGLEKIKTIGDAYMVVSGAPVQREDHAEVMAHFAHEMVEAMKQFRSISTGDEIQLRIGIHSGEVVAGVIGKKKFAYDMWGDAVNTASRMESHGEPGKIHVSEEFLKKLLMVNGEWLMEEADDLSSFTINHLPLTIIRRGEMHIKGKGLMKTYYLQKATL